MIDICLMIVLGIEKIMKAISFVPSPFPVVSIFTRSYCSPDE